MGVVTLLVHTGLWVVRVAGIPVEVRVLALRVLLLHHHHHLHRLLLLLVVVLVLVVVVLVLLVLVLPLLLLLVLVLLLLLLWRQLLSRHPPASLLRAAPRRLLRLHGRVAHHRKLLRRSWAVRRWRHHASTGLHVV